ncbi:hypothetical protein AMTRI_Chr12g272680 [Amborella trichopoda]
MFILSNRYCFPLKNQEMMGILSDDVPDVLVEKILIKLPTPSILSFKRICKSWYKLLSSPCFLHLHPLTAHSPSQPFTLFHPSSHKKSPIFTISLKHHENIMQLCEGCLMHCQPCNRPIHPLSAYSWATCSVLWILFQPPNLQIQSVGSTLNENYWRLCGLKLINWKMGILR